MMKRISLRRRRQKDKISLKVYQIIKLNKQEKGKFKKINMNIKDNVLKNNYF